MMTSLNQKEKGTRFVIKTFKSILLFTFVDYLARLNIIHIYGIRTHLVIRMFLLITENGRWIRW